MAEYIAKHWMGEYNGATRKERMGGTYQVYCPDPLATRAFSLSGETAADISDAERAILDLNAISVALSNTEALARLVLRAEALSSSRIEGLVIGARRILKAEVGSQVNDVTAQDVLNNIAAMDRALQIATQQEVSTESIQTIHAALLEHTELSRYAGEIRTVQNWIGGNYHNPCGAAYVPPSADLVPGLMDDLVQFCNEDRLSPLAQAAVAHAQFETIHPFVDGNGRTGRALIHLILRRRGLCPNVVPPISLALATMRDGYLKELGLFRHEGASDSPKATGGLNSWLGFFSAGTLRSCQDAMRFEEKIGALKQEWLGKLGEQGAKSTVTEVIDAMIGQPIFSAKLMQQATGKSLPAVNTTIERLGSAGIVKQTTAGKRNRVFEAKGILDILTNFERQLGSPAGDTAIENRRVQCP
ncbi:MAG: Fic family protein [Coriobacteriales bacterium]|jgi:Fic family protein|nr:Fic family protein [Coriobacteriales bacterium]